MKTSRSQTGFVDLAFLIVLALVFAAAIATALYSRHLQVSRAPASDSSYSKGPIPGTILVVFKDSTTYVQAQSLVKSLGLAWPKDDNTGDGPFYPVLNSTLNHTTADSVATKLRASPRVRRADLSYSTSESYDPDGNVITQTDADPQLHIIFQPDVSWPEGEQIAKNAGVTKSQDYAFSPPDKGLSLDVPVGKEGHYVKAFKSSGLVTSAEQPNYPVPL